MESRPLSKVARKAGMSNYQKRLWLYVREVVRSRFDRVAFFFAVAAFLYIVGKVVLECHSGPFARALRIGVLYEFSLAYLASYIFYLLIVALPAAQTRRQLQPIIKSAIKEMIGDAQSILRELGAPDTIQLEDANADNIQRFCNATDPRTTVGRVSMVNGIMKTYYINKWQVIAERVSRTQKSIDRLIRLAPFLDAELIHLLDKIENCTLFSEVKNLLSALPTMRNSDFAPMASTFVSYCEIVRKLEVYLNNHL